MILLVAAKGPVERAHRRALDPSENVTPNNRYELPMGIESLDRGFEIPIESQVGSILMEGEERRADQSHELER